MPELEIEILGKPIAKKRPKFFRRGGFVGTYNCQETEEGRFMNQIASAKPDGLDPITGPVSLTVTFKMPIPDSLSKKKRAEMISGEIAHIKKPDLDNLIKFVKDCANGILWKDDSQVIGIWASKFYSETPKTRICISWGVET